MGKNNKNFEWSVWYSNLQPLTIIVDMGKQHMKCNQAGIQTNILSY